MKTKPRSINKIVEEQVQKWQIMQTKKAKETTGIQVITVSREPGSGGNLVAKGVSEKLGFDLFHQEVIHEMANSAKVSGRLLETLDEKGLSVLEDWISSLVDDRHLWPDQYLQHLMKVVGAIGKYGQAVIVGRGANFILPPDKRLSVRVIAPQDVRTKNVAREFDIPVSEAIKRVLRTESNRKSFIRKYFYADIADPVNYDLVINTGTSGINAAVDVVSSALDKF
ncbi:AAA family ATPase [Thermodesulfobacteriota bacterium]